jgi:hypothetical protein
MEHASLFAIGVISRMRASTVVAGTGAYMMLKTWTFQQSPPILE